MGNDIVDLESEEANDKRVSKSQMFLATVLVVHKSEGTCKVEAVDSSETFEEDGVGFKRLFAPHKLVL